MAINYSLGKATIGNGVDNQKLRARSQSSETVSLEEIARYAAAHYSGVMDKNLVTMAVDILGKAMVDKLKEGCRVSLGDLGTFYPYVRGVAKSVEEISKEGYHPKRDIKEVSVKWTSSEMLDEEISIDKVDLKQVSRLDVRKAVMKAAEKRPEQ